MVTEANPNILSVSSSTYPNPSDMFTSSGTTETAQTSVASAILTFNNLAKITDVKVTVDNVYKTVIEVLLENGATAEKKARLFMFKIILFNEDLKKKDIITVKF